jgi:hypothetical protein
MKITDIKEKAREEFGFLLEPSEVPANTSHLDALIDRTALAVLDMVEGELPKEKDHHCSKCGTGEFCMCAEMKYEWNRCRKETISRLQALRAEIEGKKECCPFNECDGEGVLHYDDGTPGARDEYCRCNPKHEENREHDD